MIFRPNLSSRLGRWLLGLSIAGLAIGGFVASAARAQEAAGDWHGVLAVPGAELRVGVRLEAGADGKLTGALTSPDQSPRPTPIADAAVTNGKLVFSVPMVRGRYEGRWDAAKDAWVGTWSQLQPLPLVLERGPVPELARTQVPAKPYPYRETEVAFDSAPGVKLAGTLTIPPGKGPFPAAVLITGSGAQDRDESLMGHKPFLVLADHLTRHGIAVLRYDDRGFAKSTGRFATATSQDFADDAEAAVAFLRTRPEIDARRIGLVGHSEGGMIAPMVAVKDPKVAYLVMIAGPGAPSRLLMVAQREAILKALGAPPEAIARSQAAFDRATDAVLAAKDPFETKATLAKLADEQLPGADPAMKSMMEAQFAQLATPWYRFFIAYDPGPTLARVRQPILAVNGSKDLQVVASQNLPAIRAATKSNKDVTLVELPGLNHLLQTAGTGAPSEYGKIAETMSPKALETISAWIVAHTRR
jgi:pimeloyl-ACP methyl ester carboxylesterase